MPIDLSWYIPSRVIHVQVYGEAGSEQIQKMAKDLQDYMEKGEAPVHVMLDDATANPPPISIKHLKSLLDVTKQPTEKVGWVVGIGNPNPIAKVVVPTFLKIVRIKFVRRDTLEQALAFLKKQDMSLKISEVS